MTEPGLRPRRGAHRAPRSPVATFGPLIGVLVILAVIVGLVGTFSRDNDPATATAGSPPVTDPAAAPAPDPSVPAPIPSTAAPAPEPARARFEVVVLNQTGRDGLAASVAETLRAGGWKVASTGNFAGTAPATTVYFPVGGEEAAAEIAASLPVAPRVLPVFLNIDAERLTVILTDNYP